MPADLYRGPLQANLAGDGVNTHNDAVGTAASFKFPTSVAVVGNDLYVGDSNNKVIRKIDGSTLAVTTPAGMVNIAGMADGVGGAASFGSLPAMVSVDGAGSAARFDQPNGLAHDGTYLYVSDTLNNRIRRIE